MFYRKIFEMHIKISSAYKTILVIEGRKHDASIFGESGLMRELKGLPILQLVKHCASTAIQRTR
jgi:hypothetical protein